MQHAIVLLDLLFAIFVFCLIWLGLQVGTWGGVEGGCKYTAIANWQSLLRLVLTPLAMHVIIMCLLPNVFFPLINLDRLAVDRTLFSS